MNASPEPCVACNTAPFTFEELERAMCDGVWKVPPPGSRTGVVGVTDDSRECRPRMLFVAIRGEEADGHAFLEKAVFAGAAAVCVRNDFKLPDNVRDLAIQRGIGILAAPDTLAAYHGLANWHRRRFRDLVLIGVTGSNGKTSVKEMIAACLETQWPGRVLKTEGNTNNHFGVPRNLFRLTAHHRAAVIELGSNHPGEIAALARVAEPTIGVISSIGPAHLEFFGDLDGVAQEKGALFAALPRSGIAVLPLDAPGADILCRLAGSRRTRMFAVRPDPTPPVDVRAVYRGRRPGHPPAFAVDLVWLQPSQVHRLDWPICGEHQAGNAAAAAAVVDLLGVPPEEIVAGLQSASLPGMRMEVIEHEGVRWVNDAYNSNSASARAGIRCFLELSADAVSENRWVILGDMLEMGVREAEAHTALMAWVGKACTGSRILGVGPRMTAAGSPCGVRTFSDAESARAYLLPRLEPGHWVFLKGSRGMHLERILPDTTPGGA